MAEARTVLTDLNIWDEENLLEANTLILCDSLPQSAPQRGGRFSRKAFTPSV